MRNNAAFALLIPLIFLGGSVAAQEAHHIPDEPTCPKCSIALTPVLRLGATDGPGMIDWRGGQSFPAIDSRGNTYLRGYFATDLAVYDADGAFLEKIGREGEGPGELKGVNGIVVGPADSMFVFDVYTMRMSVFSPAHDFVRSTRLEIRPSGVDPQVMPWDPDHFYMTAHVNTPELIGWPIHRIDRMGTRVESFGSSTGEYRPSEPYGGMRMFADAGDGILWSGRIARYWIDRIDPHSRTPLLKIRRDAELFPVPGPYSPGDDHGNSEPRPFLTDIRQEGRYLWVLTWTVDPKWKTATDNLEDEHLKYDSIIEVIDLDTYRVVVRSRFEELYQKFLGDGRIGGTIFEGGYVPIYQIMEIRIEGMAR